MAGRDSGRSRVYAAQRLVHAVFDNAERAGSREAVFFGTRLTVPPEAKFASVESLQRYVDQVLALPSVRQRWPPRADAAVAVRKRKGDRAAHYERIGEGGVIAVPDGSAAAAQSPTGWAMRELVVLHELAHHFDSGDGGAHGPEFQETYAELAGMVMGAEAAHLLRVAFLREGGP
ncbi:MAG: TIGR04338 family metallohydrolase [Segniliparus sp.]|uniref:TIGR04338 family metallohydrolase n=1 Tax=Segniliparus sp. TaxID=2804064 RepID=UPI003F33BEB9